MDALPGVDLKMSASSVGYSYVMVVKSAEAAADLAETELALPVRGEGVDVRRSESGGLTAVEAAGAVVFEGAQPVGSGRPTVARHGVR
ncbi:hypothetical protein [Actinoplanes sp. NPDC049316]|uniref:hypothetical protein n=1 Tax=Actinoplanes sp. NPDC049316 TaxID=3154727 RepID=UPI003441D7B3